MEKFPCVVQGEASESENEQDEEPTPQNVAKLNTITDSLQGTSVLGEAPESDEDHNNIPVTSNKPPVTPVLRPQPRVWSSLLHKKLGECNISLHMNIVELIRTNVNNSLSLLKSAEQQLLKSQIKLQQASTALRSLDTTSNVLGDKLESTTHTQYIPKIYIPNFETE